MQALSLPFHIGIDGRVATATTYPEVVTDQLIDNLMTNFNERVMRTFYGSDLQRALFDPTDELMRADAAQQVAERIQAWTPRVVLNGIEFKKDDLRPSMIFVDVAYQVGPFDEARQLRMPVSAFLSEETEI